MQNIPTEKNLDEKLRKIETFLKKVAALLMNLGRSNAWWNKKSSSCSQMMKSAKYTHVFYKQFQLKLNTKNCLDGGQI